MHEQHSDLLRLQSMLGNSVYVPYAYQVASDYREVAEQGEACSVQIEQAARGPAGVANEAAHPSDRGVRTPRVHRCPDAASSVDALLRKGNRAGAPEARVNGQN